MRARTQEGPKGQGGGGARAGEQYGLSSVLYLKREL